MSESNLINQPTVRVKVQTPKEARDARDSAASLGMELKEVTVHGRWKARDGAEPSHRATFTPERGIGIFGGRKWFYLPHDGEAVACKPHDRTSTVRDSNHLEITFVAPEVAGR